MPRPLARGLCRSSAVLATLGAMISGVAAITSVSAAPAIAAEVTSASPNGNGPARLVPVRPCRLLDTRPAGPAPDPGDSLEVTVAGRCGIPVDAVAVAVTLTSISPVIDGWLSIHPGGPPWPGTSTLNLRAGEIRANGALVALGPSGSLDVLSSAGGHVLVDVTAAFLPADLATAGRFVPVRQVRVLDTRSTGRTAASEWVEVPLPGSIPSDATAVALTVTVVDSVGVGFVATRPAPGDAGTDISFPETSILNVDGSGQTRAGTTIAPIGPGGVQLFSSGGEHLVVDLAGWFTGPSAASATDGLFVPVDPIRVADTRLDGGRLVPGGSREWLVGAGSSAIAANLTLTGLRQGGWGVGYPARAGRPDVSTINAAAGETVANLALVPISDAGVEVSVSAGAEVVLDVTGRFLGTPIPAIGPPPTNEWSGPGRTVIIGDSVAASMNYSAAARSRLLVFDAVLDLVECRRTVVPSCSYRGRPPPPPAIQVLQRSGVGPVDTVVLITGYNDGPAVFAGSIDPVVAAARAVGAERIVWLLLHGGRPQFIDNNHRMVEAATRHPDLRLLDWNAISHGRSDWFAADGIHLSPTGADALAQYLVAHLPTLR